MASSEDDAKTGAALGAGGVWVDEQLRTSVRHVYAAGDCAHCGWVSLAAERDTHWFQMRLWSQAKTMGVYCARAMARALLNAEHRRERGELPEAEYDEDEEEEEEDYGFYFELFAHATRFFGMKVVLLGRCVEFECGLSVCVCPLALALF